MKKSIVLLMLILTSFLQAQNNYSSLWEQVNKLEKEALPKSALKIVDSIFQKAIKEQNNQQLIKALVYKSKFSLNLEEEAQLHIINQFKEQIEKTTFPTNSILENMLANLYWQYFTENRWKFYQRTQTNEKVTKNDFRTWDLPTLFSTIHTHFQNSIKETIKLQNIPIRTFKDILLLAENSEKYRPTLYDLLANNALEFYQTDETTINQPSYQFKIDHSDYICDNKLFAQLKLTSKDTLSLQFNALKIYQKLIQFHLKKKQLDALADIDIKRLAFVKQHATFPNSENNYLETLQTSKNIYKNNTAGGLYAFEIAKIYNQQALASQGNKNEKDRFKNKEALAICTSTIKQFPNSLAAKKCKVLETKIKQKSLTLKTEQNIPVNSYSRILVDYRNTDKLYFTIYKIDFDTYLNLRFLNNNTDKIAAIKQLKKINSWNSKLPNEFDYLHHTTEIIVPKLTQGVYLITASEKEMLKPNEVFGIGLIQATNLTFVSRQENGKNFYQILNRNSGEPLNKATVQLTNPKANRYRGRKINKTFTTDKNGEFSYNPSDFYSNVIAKIKYRNESAFFGPLYLNRNDKYSQSWNTQHRTFIFTDRSIYRPGQTLYFKGISLKSRKDKSTILTDQKVIVRLKDANYQQVTEQTFKTNDFGSFAGNFIIPNNGLTGNFTIETIVKGQQNYQYISVEEYKRPKFETSFNPITKTYTLNDLINITGLAKSYSGAAITEAKVTYRVVRKVQYPRWCYWYYPHLNTDSQEITNGKTITDSAGNFKISFKAIPDESISKDKFPIFTYEIVADVTDINGETRSATSLVKVGYQSIVASVNINDDLDKDNPDNNFKISIKNLNDKEVSASGKIYIYKLQAPKTPLRKRLWDVPFYQTISKEEFQNKFPHDPYKNEDDFYNWKKGKLVFNQSFTTENTPKEISLQNIRKWTSGAYVVEVITKDVHNKEVRDKKIFNVFSSKDKRPADNNLVSVTTNKTKYVPEETALVKVSTNARDITIMLFVEKERKVISSHYLHLNKNSKTIRIPITKNDLGGIGIRYHYVNFNEFKNGGFIIDVPYPKTDLEIITKTFRDKLQPGADETWSFKIKGTKKDQVAAELLASMYDASLDQFKQHQWLFSPIQKPMYNVSGYTNAQESFGIQNFKMENNYRRYIELPHAQYDQLNWFGFYFNERQLMAFGYNDQPVIRGVAAPKVVRKKNYAVSPEVDDQEFDALGAQGNAALDEVVVVSQSESEQEQRNASLEGVQIRKNLQETAFFFPQLTTDVNGDVSFSFTMPEALTKWKLQLLAHSKSLESATKTLETVTQKELMVTPNAPRFLRENDQITISSKISNLTDKTLEGICQLILTDALTGKSINTQLGNSNSQQKFIVDAKGNTQVSWNLKIPTTIQAVQYQVIAKSGNFSDGEQNVLPVLSNRMLVTETLPMWVSSGETKTFTLNKLKNNNSTTLKHHKLSLEITSNPVWYAVQALPYLMEYPYDCAEQTFAKYYANTLASFIANANPKIQEVFKQWKNSKALISNLEKNPELKSLIIQETPWVRDAQSETEQKKRIALLFDLNTMHNQQQKALYKLQQIQLNNGGFPWFKGSNYANPQITNHIAIGFGHLKKLGVKKFDSKTYQMLHKTVNFLDKKIAENYKQLLKDAKKIKQEKGEKQYQKFLEKQHIGYFQVAYLYMRSFYTDINIQEATQEAINFYKKQEVNYWTKFNLMGKGWIALTQYRADNTTLANKILKSLKENSINSKELGRYWKNNIAGWHWQQAPIETQALLIETFSEIENNTKTIDELKIWLLKNKQVNQWKTTKATSEAVYALLLQGNDWLASTELVTIKVGNKTITPLTQENTKIEAGTGYFKTSWTGNEINENKATVSLTKKDKGIAWGGLYWQYFEDLDKITNAKTPLQLKKQLFKKVNSNRGKKLIPISETTLEVGDLVTVRIELQADRAMEFIHMKDMRAAAFEPVNVLSTYKWQDGLGYYQSTKDAATNFFFNNLPKGVYVFEYDVRVNNKGDFSNGITTIQSMYAPEFSSHSKGERVKIQ